jgi:hypothetical protein
MLSAPCFGQRVRFASDGLSLIFISRSKKRKIELDESAAELKRGMKLYACIELLSLSQTLNHHFSGKIERHSGISN